MEKINIKTLRHQLEYSGLFLLMLIFNFIQPDNASNFGGWLGRKIGPHLKINRIAREHLQTCLPGKTDAEYKAILIGMWDNLGRILAEYTDPEFFTVDMELAGVEHLKKAIEDHGQAIVFSGHIGNWELMAPTLLRYDVPIDLVYRPLNNPYVDKMLAKCRSMDGRLHLLPKSRAGTRQLVESVKIGRSVGILIDQKYNEGIDVPFFSQPAMTSPAFVQLGQKYNCPLVPFRVERLQGINFRLSFYPPLKLMDDAGEPRRAEDVLGDAHHLLEEWITERPDQWLWLHKRWKKTG